MRYGLSQRGQFQDTVFFYVVPWKKLLVLLVGMLLIGVALSLVLHRRYAHKDDNFIDIDDDGSAAVPLYVKDGVSGAVHHDIDMKPRL
jgi:hypothetical protein